MKKTLFILSLTIFLTACSLDSLDPGKIEVSEDEITEESSFGTEETGSSDNGAGEFEKEMPSLNPGENSDEVDLEDLDEKIQKLSESLDETSPATVENMNVIEYLQYPSDLAGCADLEDPNQRGSCEFNILNALAETEADPSHCEGISLEDLRENCQLNAENPEDLT